MHMKDTKTGNESNAKPNTGGSQSRPNLIAGMELEEFLSEGSKYKLKIEKIVNELGSSFSLLLAAAPADFSRAKIPLLKMFAKEKGIILYITFNQSASKLISELGEKGIQTTSIFFIDMVSKEKGYETADKGVSMDFESPTQLTDLMLAVDEKMLGKKPSLVVLDSISTLLVYNDRETVQKFVHSLIAKVQKANSKVVLLATKDSSSADALATIGQFCDKFAVIE